MIFLLSGTVPDSMLAEDHDPERSYAPDFLCLFNKFCLFILYMFSAKICLQ